MATRCSSIVCPKSWVVFAFCNGIDIGEFWDIKTLASFKSLAPGRCGNNAKSVISEHMLWIKSEGMFVKLICKHLWWHLNIGSDNGLVPSDNKQVIIWTNVEPDLLRLKCLKRNSFLWYPNISISNGSCESNIWPKKLPPCIHSKHCSRLIHIHQQPATNTPTAQHYQANYSINTTMLQYVRYPYIPQTQHSKTGHHLLPYYLYLYNW